MLAIERTNKFKKDVKLMIKRGRSIQKLRTVVENLVNKEPLEIKYRDHALSGNFSNSRECHIEPDWLLIYKSDEKILCLERTGTHSDLFR